MLKFIRYFFTLSFFVMVSAYNQQGDGIWSVIDIGECDAEVENVIFGLKIKKYKANRTQDVFGIEVDATMDIDDSFVSFIDVCKHMDGGCKHYTNIKGGFKKLLNTYGKQNLERAFRLANIDPPEFPIPKGHHGIEDFIMDYCELPTYSAYGRFEAEAFVDLDDEHVGCVKAVVEFAQTEEDVC